MIDKRCYFDDLDYNSWPKPEVLKSYFIAPKGKEWSFRGGNDNWGLSMYPDGYGPLKTAGIIRKAIELSMVGHQDYGVFLHWSRRGFGFEENYFSNGNLSKLSLQVRSLQSDAWPLGLFIPFAEAWLATEDFIASDGARSDRIDWIAAADLPHQTFIAQDEATCIND